MQSTAELPIMAEVHMPHSFLKKLLSLFNGFVAVSGMVLTGLALGVMYGEATMTRVLGMSSAYLFHFGYLSLGMGCITRVLSLPGRYGMTTEKGHAPDSEQHCGVNTDFFGSSFQVTTGRTYPRGCCKSIGAVNRDRHNVSSDVIYQEKTGFRVDAREARVKTEDLPVSLASSQFTSRFKAKLVDLS
ncbi:tetraspanin-16 [Peromyscus maniculatus bairdii]|uniref:tetraspanin-16 n=1 Tax=Peromyscus maniculatus bairdii TaxID=230844 RepID=UPI003FCEFFD2